MPCMCGDLYCRSCGPAQGNQRCRQCGRWTDEGGCLEPKKCEAFEAAAVEAEYQDYLRMEKEGDKYWNRDSNS